MAKLAAYFDDSGTHDQSLAIVVAGYLSSEENWEDFSRAWVDVLRESALTHWHQVHFAHRVKEYTGWTDKKRVEFMQRATKIINDTVIGGVVCGVDATAFKELSSRFPAPPYTPYAFCAMVCFKHLEKWAAENFHFKIELVSQNIRRLYRHTCFFLSNLTEPIRKLSLSPSSSDMRSWTIFEISPRPCA